MMKKIGFVLQLVIGSCLLSGCGSDNDEMEEDSSLEFPKTSLAPTKYSLENLFARDGQAKVSDNGSWKITTYGDAIVGIDFEANPPASADEFISRHIPTSSVNSLKFVSSYFKYNSKEGYASYRQSYNDIPVWRGISQFLYNEQGEIYKYGGHFVPIKDLDTMPKISEEKANRIAKDYLGVETSAYLYIVPFFADGQVDVRLAYECSYLYGCFGASRCIVDARTGEVLCSKY